MTFYVDPKVVYEKISKPAQAVYGCETIRDANTKLNEAGIRTELDIEMELHENLGRN